MTPELRLALVQLEKQAALFGYGAHVKVLRESLEELERRVCELEEKSPLVERIEELERRVRALKQTPLVDQELERRVLVLEKKA